MPQFTVDQLKAHLVLVDDDGSQDAEILEKSLAAENWIKEHLRRDLDSEDPQWPFACRQAVKMLVTMYFERGVTLSGDEFETQIAPVKWMLEPFRSFA